MVENAAVFLFVCLFVCFCPFYWVIEFLPCKDVFKTFDQQTAYLFNVCIVMDGS